ncbi:oligoendopeptidase F [Desulfobacter postgatei]|uniref:Oligopeptidase F n=1 Tax=Desulfobacter postgatei 2ac9 TaxID=879212 RepID=I5B737_9BACT|nr:oligoendopeptidase F [Desulfobacter postgatei]EIM65300.1 oligoendopeptidase F [Desulfobacter postgatei 2ac9]
MVHQPDTPRKEVLQSDCWDLSPMFQSIGAWESLFQALEKKIPTYENFKGTLSQGPDILLACIEFDHGVSRDMDALYTFSHLKNDEDKTQSDNEGLFQRASNLYTRIGEASSFISPEIQAMPLDQLTRLLDKEAFKPYRFYLEQMIRYIPHTRDAPTEQLLAMAGESLSAPQRIFSQLDNADLNFGRVKTPAGDVLPLTHGNFITFLGNKERSFRKTVFEQYYQTYHDHRHTIAATLGASVKKDLFWARARHFDSARKSALFADNVPEDVYDNLIINVKKSFSPLYRYLDFRKQALGVDDLHMYDTYVQLVPDIDFHMDYEQAVATCIEALEPLGRDYCRTLEQGLLQGWVDRYENKGKQSGAYSSGCYDSNPYILLNYDPNSINSLFTLIHEAGHSMHSFLANKAQPYPTHGYTIFVAEVASTLNEALLARHLLEKYKDDPKMKAYILNREIDNIRGTFFRQTMFAEFEHIIHGLAGENQPLTIKTFTSVYKDLLSVYFGDNMIIDEALTLECLRIPHFYSSFYVYKYATGLAAALGIAQRITDKGKAAVDDYLDFLKLGGAMFPIDELRVAGVDMATITPVQAAASHFESRIRELETLWPSI